MSWARNIKENVAAKKAKESRVYWQAVDHHNAYMEAAGFTRDEMDTMRDSRTLPSIKTSQGWVTPYPEMVCGLHYGDTWRPLLLMGHKDNESVGYGTTFVTVLPEALHHEVLAILRED